MMKRKILLILLIFCLLLLAGCKGNHTASEEITEAASEFISEENTEALTAYSAEPEIAPAENSYSFKSACFYCLETDEMLFEYNPSEKIYPASLAKILTASTALYYEDIDTEFTVGTELCLLKPHSSLCLIKKGHRLTLGQLITGMLLPSGNDAAYTIAVSIARKASGEKLSDSEALKYFCELMNSFAGLIGMKGSHFTSPDGWDDKRQYTTAKDLLVLTRYALTVPTIRDTVSLSEKYVVFKSGENITWQNTNQLLSPGRHFNQYAIGMKTGTTENAGNCLIAVFSKNGLTYIAVVCGASDSDSRYEDANRLFNTYSR